MSRKKSKAMTMPTATVLRTLTSHELEDGAHVEVELSDGKVYVHVGRGLIEDHTNTVSFSLETWVNIAKFILVVEQQVLTYSDGSDDSQDDDDSENEDEENENEDEE